MTRRPDPLEGLGPRLTASAGMWQKILGFDASVHQIFGRVSALSLVWAELHREALDGFGINFAELTVLGVLRVAEPDHRRSPTELRRLIGQSSAGMTRILDKLETDGHLRREDIEGDRRRVDIVLTSSGAVLAERAVAALLAVETGLIATVAPRDREMVTKALDTLLAAFAARAK